MATVKHAEAQTDVHFEHSVKSVTLVPVPDDLKIVFDGGDSDGETEDNQLAIDIGRARRR